MNPDYDQLIDALFAQLGMAAVHSDDGIYSLDVDGRLQIMIGLHQETWLLLFWRAERLLTPSTNLFGQTWPAHVQGELEGHSILWSQQRLAGMTVLELQRWLEQFIEDAAARLDASHADAKLAPYSWQGAGLV